MREILFKGKCIRTDKWVYGYLSNADVINTDKGRLKVHRETVSQYTGLKDKNGVKIFEGDILSNYEHDVIYKDGAFRIESKTCYFVLTQYMCNSLEIIGNIHDK